jgi:hypothetical protein
MFKVAAVLLMLVVASHGFLSQLGQVGSYVNRPELLNDPTVQALVKFASESLSKPENALKALYTTRVETQVVAGMNYRINFIAELAEGKTTSCQVVIFVSLSAEQKMTEFKCDTA